MDITSEISLKRLRQDMLHFKMKSDEVALYHDALWEGWISSSCANAYQQVTHAVDVIHVVHK